MLLNCRKTACDEEYHAPFGREKIQLLKSNIFNRVGSPFCFLSFFFSLNIGHRLQPVGDGSQGGQMGGGGDGERWGSDRGPRGSLNEQIAVVLMRLQEDMQNVLQRLHMLETVTASQVLFTEVF